MGLRADQAGMAADQSTGCQPQILTVPPPRSRSLWREVSAISTVRERTLRAPHGRVVPSRCRTGGPPDRRTPGALGRRPGRPPGAAAPPRAIACSCACSKSSAWRSMCSCWGAPSGQSGGTWFGASWTPTLHSPSASMTLWNFSSSKTCPSSMPAQKALSACTSTASNTTTARIAFMTPDPTNAPDAVTSLMQGVRVEPRSTGAGFPSPPSLRSQGGSTYLCAKWEDAGVASGRSRS